MNDAIKTNRRKEKLFTIMHKRSRAARLQFLSELDALVRKTKSLESKIYGNNEDLKSISSGTEEVNLDIVTSSENRQKYVSRLKEYNAKLQAELDRAYAEKSGVVDKVGKCVSEENLFESMAMSACRNIDKELHSLEAMENNELSTLLSHYVKRKE